MILQLAGRNFLRHVKSYLIVWTALSLGFAVVVVLLGITGGMTQTLKTKASRYFAGDLALWSFSPNRTFTNEADIENLLRSWPSATSQTRRSEYYGSDGALNFTGTSVRQRKIVGIDWFVERANFKQLEYVDGSTPEPGDTRGLLISEASAKRLGARVGDDLTVILDTLTGEKNTLDLIVRGIYQDTSLFGYASYLDIETLNTALGLPRGSATALGLVLRPGFDSNQEGVRLRDAMSRIVPTYPMIFSRDELNKAMDSRGQGSQVAVMTLGANLAQINNILDALVAVAVGATLVFLGIVVIGVGNTYRMVVFERTRELGTLRALGLTKARLVALVATEAGWLALAGAVTGGLLGTGLLWMVSIPQWVGGESLAGLFFHNRRLLPEVQLLPLCGALLVLVTASFIGALGPAIRAARLRPVDALRSGE